MPREIICKQPRIPSIYPYGETPLLAGQVRARTEFASPKHGTEMHSFRGDEPQVHDYFDEEYNLFLPRQERQGQAGYGFRPGNMWTGRIIELGEGVTGLQIGQRVAGYGSFRETQTLKASDVLAMPDRMAWQQALCYDPCQFALGGIRDSQLRLGDTCCVIGMGAIGQMAAQMAKLAGARLVVVSDPIEARRRIALENGADAAIDPAAQDMGLELKKLTQRLGVDVAIETSSAYPAMQQALRGVAYGGRIAVVGWYSPVKTGMLDYGREAHFNNATLFFSRACSEPNPDHPRWSWNRINQECWTMLSRNLLKCDNVIAPVVPFEDACAAYLDCVDAHPEKSVKMGVRF